MNSPPLAKDTGLGVSIIVSAVIHLTVFLLVVWRVSHMAPLKVQETYYVDVVNLPVAAPRSGSPSQKGDELQPLPPPIPKNSVTPMAMPVPAQPATKPVATKAAQKPATAKNSPAEPSSEFAERMSKLERVVEDKQAEAAMARMREKLKNKGTGRAGMPGASGKEAGSDYLAYLKSRLKDAFDKTISYTSKNPEMTVRLFIDPDGKLSRKKTERSSGDRAFEMSVLRAIDTASEKFTPPPGRKIFEGVFVFKPDGVMQNKP